MKKLGVGIVGLGMAAKPHLVSLAQLQDIATVCGVYSTTATKRNNVGKEHGMPVSSSLEELLEHPELNALLVLTPPNARKEIVAAAAQAGKALLVEKPLERTVRAAQEIVATCTKAKVPLGVVLQHRYRSDVCKLKEILTAGKLGMIGAARLNFPWWRAQNYYDEKGRGTYERDGGGVLISQTIHILDLMLYLLGPVDEVQAYTATTSLHNMETEDFVVAGLQFSSGASGSVMATTAAFPGQPEELIIEGELGSARLYANVLTISWRDGRTETHGTARGTGSGADPMAFGPELHQALIRDFINNVQAGRESSITGTDALRVQKLIEAIIKAGKDNQRTSVLQEESVC